MQKVNFPAQINHPELLRTQAYIDGKWVDADDGALFEVDNPATQSVVAHVANLGPQSAVQAIAAAERALPAWRALTAKARSVILKKWFDLINLHADDLARIMTVEQGKPFAEAKGEITYGASFVEWFAEQAKRVMGDTIASPIPNARILVLKEPIGVCAAITPWNFPSAMITRKVSPALAAGCTVVLKPAEQTPLSALALAQLAHEAGIPPGVLNILSADSERSIAIGKELCESSVVRKLTFTGSTQVGRILMQQCAPTIKKLSLELGGNAPFIAFEDADIDAAIEGAMASKYRNAGQTCVCTNRFYVHTSIYDTFVQKLAQAVESRLKVGEGFEDAVTTGPLIDNDAIKKVEAHLADALSKGARIVTGGKPDSRGGRFFQPTVLADVNSDMICMREETFGPVAPIVKFTDEADVIKLANDTEFGLAAYFYSRDIGRIFRVAEALEYGIIGVNAGIISNEVAPFGGVKQSGLGREGSVFGIEEFLEMKYVCLGGI
jgi:succinate-semialdehyde dehydrogenase/glutarate-semialdehyde dehydrogenase|tara:strand:- start:614 stop:2098 length:1485 start_codon:yes stop_codon:yes gene_type:complete